jgi:hypothetical protein
MFKRGKKKSEKPPPQKKIKNKTQKEREWVETKK